MSITTPYDTETGEIPMAEEDSTVYGQPAFECDADDTQLAHWSRFYTETD